MEAPPWQPPQTGKPEHQPQYQQQQQPSAVVVGLSSPRAVVPTLLSALKRPRNGAASQGLDLVPCKARGMPPDHYSKTAYFAIDPSKIQHGDELVCSYPLCSAKIKFRWCYFCGIPVAKRNFRGRHGHSGETMDAASEDQPMHRTKTSTTAVSGNQDERAGATTAFANSTAPSNVSVSQSLLVHKDEFPTEVVKVTTLAQRARWAYLLGTRPPTNRSAEMVSWMTQVLAVSDEHKKNDTLPRQKADEATKKQPPSREDCTTVDHDPRKPAVTLAGSSAVASSSDALGTTTNGTRTESSFTEDPSSTSSTMMDDEVRRAGSLSDSRKMNASANLRNPRKTDGGVKDQEPNASSSGPSACDVDSSGSDSSPSDESQKPSGSSSSSSSNDEPQKRSLSNRSEGGTTTTADIIKKTLRDLRRRTQRDEDRAQDPSSNSLSSGSDEDSRSNYSSSSLHGSEEYSGSNSSTSSTRRGDERQEVAKTRPTDNSGESFSSSGTNSDDSESRSAGRKRPRSGHRYKQERSPRPNKKERKSAPVADTSSSFSESDDYSSSTDSGES